MRGGVLPRPQASVCPALLDGIVYVKACVLTLKLRWLGVRDLWAVEVSLKVLVLAN